MKLKLEVMLTMSKLESNNIKLKTLQICNVSEFGPFFKI